MGSGSDTAIPFLIFAIVYLSVIGLLLGSIGRNTEIYIYNGEEISVVGFTFGLFDFSMTNIVMNISELGAWNAVVFAPFFIIIGYIIFALLYPL